MESVRPATCLVWMALLSVVFVALLPDRASACSCGMPGGLPQERAKRALSDSTAVFVGEVVEFDKPPPATTMIEGTMWTIMGGGPPATVTLQTSEVWKGPWQEKIEVATENDSGGGCGYPFVEGERYLVYATGEEPSVSLCSETKPLSEADVDLKALGDGKAPEPGGVLSDTSGGIPVGAVTGLAGLTILATFALAARLLRAG